MWDNLINAESEYGTWDFFNYGEDGIKLCKFEDDVKVCEIAMTKQEWVELAGLVKRITK